MSSSQGSVAAAVPGPGQRGGSQTPGPRLGGLQLFFFWVVQNPGIGGRICHAEPWAPAIGAGAEMGRTHGAGRLL